jgi:transaldolase
VTPAAAPTGVSIEETARALALEGFQPPGERRFGSRAAWAALRAAGTELWLDTGDLEAARRLWTDDFSNLTTNNTLVNAEVQKGLFDEVIPRVGAGLRDAGVRSSDELVIETGFVVNCRTALRLVEAFDATVSVELHPAMAHDAERSAEYGRRYYAVCPERFIIKVPMTPAGFLAARRLSDDAIPVNYTLGFSARQNVLAAAFSRPSMVNVFMGRLNEFVSKNGLGDGQNVGEKTTMATQLAIREGRERRDWTSRLIGASMRYGTQLLDLAGLDIFTMPVKAAEEFQTIYERDPQPIRSQVGRDFPVEAEPAAVLDCLWTVGPAVHRAAEAVSEADTEGWTGRDFAAAIRDAGAPGLFREWTRQELDQVRDDGKIPPWTRWKEELISGRVGLDELMSVSALQSFEKDQRELDDRLRRLLRDAGIIEDA